MPLPAAMALSGLSEEAFGTELKSLFNHGAKLLEPLSIIDPSESKCDSAAMTDRTTSMESGIASMPNSSSSGSTNSSDTYWDFISKLDEVKLEQLKPQYFNWPDIPAPSTPRSLSTPTPEPVIKHGNRDILDLGSNILGFRKQEFKTTVLPGATVVPRSFLLENRSQYSRMYGDFVAPKKIVSCPMKDCKFETSYYELPILEDKE